MGLNYRSKAARAGRDLPTDPILFLAAPTSVAAPGARVAVPAGVTEEMDYEAEIALVIGRPLYRASESQVWDCIAGITSANDMTARDVMRATATPVLAKSFPGFKPLGPSVCTVDEFAQRDDIPVRSWVNDELQQDDTSAGFIFQVPELLARISRHTPLRPGDVVLTGTPAGTGQDRGCFLVPGDRIRIEIGPLLPLITTVVDGHT
ncbi:fumarylacetoacetate hydrolase family protein [Nocardioides alcanivorans]|uniref:fumarylacetoacetate hydrolase family protein n=1 Tax=Nocardioides alcanivorans TaxID=2897352 RepID=UPI001F419A7C|nr:fumarylacetoacetate hydrolase family protein [Nocardioides alcanivorans]